MVTFNVHGKEYKIVFGYGLLRWKRKKPSEDDFSSPGTASCRTSKEAQG